MTLVYEVQAEDVAGLNDVQLTRLLKMLLHQESRVAGIAQRAVDVALNIRVADGGEDGRIQWEDGPAHTDYLPCRFVQFQNKATQMGPTACADELVAHDEIKPRIDEALSAGAAYILFTTQMLNTAQKDERITRIREKLREHGKDYADTAVIEVYDASTIQGWVNRNIAAITAVLDWIGRPLVTGLQTWEHWERYGENHVFEFIADDHRNAGIQEIREQLGSPKRSARIIGLSGLGKTRLALEICRGDSSLDGLLEGVIYVDAGVIGNDLIGVVSEWVKQKLKGTLVVDNCELGLHQSLNREIKHPDSELSLLTIHFNPEKDDNTSPFCLEPMSDELIKTMLQSNYGESIPDLDRVVSFAQGFPQMAVLLANARLDQSPSMGSLTDDYLVQKMLWGGGDKNDDDEKILRACSLFEKFGIEEDAAVESKFIANQVANTDEDSLYDCIKRFESRGVVNSVGRYSQIIPKPLAIRLAGDWWQHTRRPRQEELIATDMPGLLENSFCDQISKMDFLPEVKDLTADLCGIQGPFGQAEVILSERGSRLFRALVEVNPSATTDSLYRVFSNLEKEAIESIRGDIRRNLVWSLEKLCFREDTFDQAARVMLALAASENESWSNNATGQFIQLFRVFLSGTAAPPASRLHLIDEALQSPDDATRLLAIEALSTAIDTYGGSRAVGAEYQGSGAPLEEWRPTIWQEAFDYWIAAINKLTVLAIHDTPEGIRAKRAIGRNIRGLVSKSQGLMETLNDSIRAVVDAQGTVWPEALESIKHSLSYDAEHMPQEAVDTLREWVELLSPVSLEEKLRLLVSIPLFEHEEDEQGNLVDIAALNAIALARELAGDLEILVSHLPQLLRGEQRHAYTFGKELVSASGTWEPLLTAIIEFLHSTSEANPNLLFGVLAGVYELEPADWEKIVEDLSESESPELVDLYPGAITTGTIVAKHLENILKALESGQLKETSVSILAYGRNTDSLSANEIKSFTVRLSRHSDASGWVALDILSMYCHGNKTRFEETVEAFKEILANLNLEENLHLHGHMGAHLWETAARKVLTMDSNSEFAVQLVRKLLSSRLEKISYSDIRHAIQPVLRVIFTHYGRDVWPLIGDAIVKASPSEMYTIAQILGADDHSDRGKHPSVLSELPNEILVEWCAAVPDVGPEFVASATEAFVSNEDGFQLSPTAQFLIDEYGESEKVLSALASNMGSFGWTGSAVPHYEKELSALEPLEQHQKAVVRNWATRRIQYLNERIKHEKVREEEHSIGIY